MGKLYKVVNNFHDLHDENVWHTPKDTPIELTEQRVAEINSTEKIVGYKLIEEVKVPTAKPVKEKEIKK